MRSAIQRAAQLLQTGRLAELETLTRRHLLANPADGWAWRFLGQSLWMQGKDALFALQRTAELLPEDADAIGNLATALRARGALEDSVVWYRRALKRRPQFAEAHNNLGGALEDLGQYQEAESCFRKALELKPEFAVALTNLAGLMRRRGQFEQAEQHFRRAADLDPAFFPAISGLGNTLQDLGRVSEALVAHRHGVEIAPADTQAHLCLGNVLLDLQQPAAARMSYIRALELHPDHTGSLEQLASALRLLSRGDEARAVCLRVLELDPQRASAWTLRARLQSDEGEFDGAEASLRRAVDLDPDAADALAAFAGTRRLSAGDAPWAIEAARVAQLPLAPRRVAALEFALGKYHDDIKEYDSAFGHYRRANELTRSVNRPHDPHAVTQEFDALIAAFDRSWIERCRLTDQTSRRPVLIVGLPRSGTTLTEQIIAAHPAAHGAGELGYWVPLLRRFASEQSLASLDVPALRRMAEGYLSLLEERSSAARVVDKMPANFECLGAIHAAMPTARLIHIRRNPLDTCLSIYFQDFNASHGYASDLEHLAHYYREYERLMDHWRTALPAECLLEVVYEDLVEDPLFWSRRLLDFVGLPWDDRCLKPGTQQRSTVMTFSQWQVRQGINQRSKARWRNYRAHLGPLLTLTADPCAASLD